MGTPIKLKRSEIDMIGMIVSNQGDIDERSSDKDNPADYQPNEQEESNTEVKDVEIAR